MTSKRCGWIPFFILVNSFCRPVDRVGVSYLPVNTSEARKKLRMYNILADLAYRITISLHKKIPNVLCGIWILLCQRQFWVIDNCDLRNGVDGSRGGRDQRSIITASLRDIFKIKVLPGTLIPGSSSAALSRHEKKMEHTTWSIYGPSLYYSLFNMAMAHLCTSLASLENGDLLRVNRYYGTFISNTSFFLYSNLEWPHDWLLAWNMICLSSHDSRKHSIIFGISNRFCVTVIEGTSCSTGNDSAMKTKNKLTQKSRRTIWIIMDVA